MPHFLETLFGTKHPSFVIGSTLTTMGTVYGPTIFQGDVPPDPTMTSMSGQITPGDLWIQTGPSPSINQYIGNAWVAMQANVVNTIASIAYVDGQIANTSNAVITLMTNYVDNSVANAVFGLANTTYVDGQINLVTTTLPAIINLGLTANIDAIVLNSVASATIGLATTQYVDDQITTALGNVASIQYVDDQIANISVAVSMSTEISNAIANATSGLASLIYVDGQISNVTQTLAEASNAAVANAVSGLATVQYVDAQISSATNQSDIVANVLIATAVAAESVVITTANGTVYDIPVRLEALEFVAALGVLGFARAALGTGAGSHSGMPQAIANLASTKNITLPTGSTWDAVLNIFDHVTGNLL